MVNKPTIAIAYDFDGTLAPGNMQEHAFIPSLGLKAREFWKKVHAQTKEYQADENLIYMKLMIEESRLRKKYVGKQELTDKGKGLRLFEGVEDWFKFVNNYGKERGVVIEHYLISSGIDEIVRGTSIAKEFKNIYASKFIYDENDIATWPALAVNYTNKTQYLFRINKGDTEDLSSKKVNEYIPKDQRLVPFENMIYIGDGETDVPCFRTVREQGGMSVGVYEPNIAKKRKTVERLKDEGRIDCYFPAKYSQDSPLSNAILKRIEFICSRFELQKAMKK